jgi:small subunit ribosomal protein S17
MADETNDTEETTEEATEETEAKAKAAAQDAERALEAVQAEAAAELPADDVEAAVPVPGAASRAAKTAGTPAATQPEPAQERARANRRKVREGVVVSDSMTSTVVVAVVERVRHPRYGKTVQRTKKLYVHDAEDTAKLGDRVRVQETRPISKLKRWRLTEVVERAR